MWNNTDFARGHGSESILSNNTDIVQENQKTRLEGRVTVRMWISSGQMLRENRSTTLIQEMKN